MTREENIEYLKEAHKKGQLIPFLGAGLSSRLGLPSWRELMGHIAARVDFDPEVFLTHGDYRQLAQYGVITTTKLGPIRLRISDLMHTQEADQRRKTSRAHELLAKWHFATIYTTNFDHHIERAFADWGMLCDRVASLSDLQKARREGATRLVKFHGDLDDDTSLVLDETSYFKRLRFEDPLDFLLRSDSLQNSFLFLGYSFQDPNIRYVWHALWQMKEGLPAHAKQEGKLLRSLVAGHGYGEVQEAILRSWDIDLIKLDPADPDTDVDMILQEIVG